VIVPVHNGATLLEHCLAALSETRGVTWECIVVDDGSSDGSGDRARDAGATVIRSDRPRSGPANARNLGARVAIAPLLCFVDADVLVQPDTLAEFVRLFKDDAGLTAAFGSYDRQPYHQDAPSQYRNLLHHFVHQTSSEYASTFWAGCGVIRREAFLAVGGFDADTYARPSIEDIELGYRLCAANGRIRLAKHIQVKHLKRWTLWGIIKTDIRDRALPWTDLIARTGHLPNDLNLNTASRASALSVYALVSLLALATKRRIVLAGIAVPLLILFAANRGLYTFFVRQRGPGFLVAALFMHWLYFAYSALAFAGGMAYGRVRMRRRVQVAGKRRAEVADV
jgi:GT2 family glycosyltransferase